jgi:hypothetical protein
MIALCDLATPNIANVTNGGSKPPTNQLHSILALPSMAINLA